MALIAVIEHDLQRLASLCDVLLAAGHGVVTFEHAEELLRHEGAVEVDLIIMDLALSGAKGLAIARRVRELEPFDVPMIAVSDAPFPQQMAARSDLFRDTISRPFDAPALLESVAHALATQKMDAG